jgi:hypothetical protein
MSSEAPKVESSDDLDSVLAPKLSGASSRLARRPSKNDPGMAAQAAIHGGGHSPIVHFVYFDFLSNIVAASDPVSPAMNRHPACAGINWCGSSFNA